MKYSPKIYYKVQIYLQVVSGRLSTFRSQRCNYINTTGVTNGAGTAYNSGAPEFTTGS
jgi:hypothetical protein